MQQEIKQMIFEVTLEYSNDKPKSNKEFYQQPGPVLVKQCGIKTKEKLSNYKIAAKDILLKMKEL